MIKKIKMANLILVIAILLFSGCVQKSQENQTKIGENITGEKIGELVENITGKKIGEIERDNTEEIENITGEKTVKIGSRIFVDYIAYLDGKVVDTSIEKIAKENGIIVPNKTYRPITFVIGKGKVIKGLEEGVIGMKEGEYKTLKVSPEKGYGKIDPQLIQTIPVIQKIPIERTFTKDFDISSGEFELTFGSHKTGDNVILPGSNVNLTILEINESDVKVRHNLTVGYEIIGLAPWKEIVIKIDDKNVTVRSEPKKNEVVQIKDSPWNSTILDIDPNNITLRHNSIPDTKVRTNLGFTKIHFNDTYITVDSNSEYAGKTLTYNVTVISIN